MLLDIAFLKTLGEMRAILVAVFIVHVFVHDHAHKKGFVIKTKKGKSYLAESAHSHGNQKGKEKDSAFDYAVG